MPFWETIKGWMIRRRQTTPNDPGREPLIIPISRTAGVRVTNDSSLGYAAVWASVRIISETIAGLPWHVMERRPNGNREPVENSTVERLLNRRPNTEMSAFQFRETLMAWALLWGNGYAEIERDAKGHPIALWPLSPDNMRIVRDETGRLVYVWRSNRGIEVVLAGRDVFHLRGLGWDGVQGYSILEMAAKSIGLGIAVESFGASFFSNGSRPGGVLTTPEALTEEAKDQIRRAWERMHRGVDNTQRVAILESGLTWQQIGIPPDDAQFLETRKFQTQEIARWFRVPPHKLADLERATFSNIEQQSIEFVTDALMPWTIRLEQEANIKLFSSEPRKFTRININGLLRGDMKARSEFYKTMSQLGVFTINDILALEDMNTIGKDGDVRIIQSNLTTLEKLIEQIEPPLSTITVRPQSTQDKEEQDETEQQLHPSERTIHAHRRIMREYIERILGREISLTKDAIRKAKNRPQEFAKAMTRIYDEHHSYMRQVLWTPLTALAEQIAGKITPRISTILELACDYYIDGHIGSSREQLRALFLSGDESVLDDWKQGRCDEAIEFLVDRVVDAICLGGILMEKRLCHSQMNTPAE